MASLVEDFGTRGGMIPPLASSSNLSPQVPALVESRSLSDVIVRSFEAVNDMLNEQDNRNKDLDTRLAVTRGIDESKIPFLFNSLKGSLSDLGNKLESSQGTSDSSGSNNYYRESYYKTLQEDFLESKQKREEKEAETERKARLQRYEQSAEKVLKDINTVVTNPLKGLSNFLDKGVKQLFTGVQALWNKPVKDIKSDAQAFAAKLVDPFAARASVVSPRASFTNNTITSLNQDNATETDLGLEDDLADTPEHISVLSVDKLEVQSYSPAVSNGESVEVDQEYIEATYENLSERVIVPEDDDDIMDAEVVTVGATELSKSEQDIAEQQEQEQQEKEDGQVEAQIEATNAVNYTVGEVVTKVGEVALIVGGVLAILPLIKGVIADWQEDSKYTWPKLMGSIDALAHGPLSIPKQLEIMFSNLLSKIRIPGIGSIFGGLSSEESRELQSLEEQKTKEERLRNEYASQLDQLKQTIDYLNDANQGDASKQISVENYDLTTEEGLNQLQVRMAEAGAFTSELEGIDDLKEELRLFNQWDEVDETTGKSKAQRYAELKTLQQSPVYTEEQIKELEQQQQQYEREVKAQRVTDVIVNTFDLDRSRQVAKKAGFGAELELKLEQNNIQRENLAQELTANQKTIQAVDQYKQSWKDFAIHFTNNLVGAGAVTSATAAR